LLRCVTLRNAAALPKPDQAIDAASAQSVARVFTFRKESLEHRATMWLGCHISQAEREKVPYFPKRVGLFSSNIATTSISIDNQASAATPA
jgi:hypothetical protein